MKFDFIAVSSDSSCNGKLEQDKALNGIWEKGMNPLANNRSSSDCSPDPG